jgi:hypothetical protein
MNLQPTHRRPGQSIKYLLIILSDSVLDPKNLGATPEQALSPLKYGNSKVKDTESIKIYKKAVDEGRKFIERKIV